MLAIVQNVVNVLYGDWKISKYGYVDMVIFLKISTISWPSNMVIKKPMGYPHPQTM